MRTDADHADFDAWLTAETPLERFERIAAQFHRETGFLAPGKDVPAAMSYSSYDEERRAAWEAWCEKQSKVPA